MVSVRSHTVLSVPRIMSVLLVLPLLLAHRHPIQARSRASILRRMPMFYGKRDPSLASPLSAAASSPVHLGPSSRYLAEAAAATDHLAQDFGFRSPAARTRHRGVKTAKQRFASDKRSGDQSGGPPPVWALLSSRASGLQSLANGAGAADDSGNGAPGFWDSDLRRRSYRFGASGRYGKAVGSAPDSREDRLKRRLKVLGRALGYNGDVRQPPEEDTSDFIPLELSNANDKAENVDDIYYDKWLDHAVVADEEGGFDEY